ncbi:hypothetical protein [uncultured Litoreibacter sp.]|uniref:hypothetical protein n=1 Tax=uncultured Litoreibacter sp. TaxID=1392394 RepID=UPI0026395E2E|nr:hypothetical protein [uncultured Litoreibacter sp.]
MDRLFNSCKAVSLDLDLDLYLGNDKRGILDAQTQTAKASGKVADDTGASL